MSTVSTMQPCRLMQVMDLLELCAKESIECSLDMKLANCYLDSFLSVCNVIPRVAYEELDGGDCLTLEMGEAEFGFEVNSQFHQSVDGNQISLAISNEQFTVFIASQGLSRKALLKARTLLIKNDDERL